MSLINQSKVTKVKINFYNFRGVYLRGIFFTFQFEALLLFIRKSQLIEFIDGYRIGDSWLCQCYNYTLSGFELTANIRRSEPFTAVLR